MPTFRRPHSSPPISLHGELIRRMIDAEAPGKHVEHERHPAAVCGPTRFCQEAPVLSFPHPSLFTLRRPGPWAGGYSRSSRERI